MLEIKQYDQQNNEKNIIKLLEEHQIEHDKISLPDPEVFSFAAFDDKQYLGGITGKITGGDMYISLLALNPSTRGQGVGKKLMQKVEAYARKQGVHLITLTTYDYQAPDFYQANGFEIYATLKDSPEIGTKKLYLCKYL